MKLSTTSWLMTVVACAAAVALVLDASNVLVAVVSLMVLFVAAYMAGWCDGFLRGVKR